jgi:hypothetical protein
VISSALTKSWLFRGVSVITVCLLATFVFPLIAMITTSLLPTSVSNLFFFLSQFIFPYDMLVVSGTFPLSKAFHPGTALALNLFNWGGISLLFAWYFQKTEKLNYLFLWAAITVFLVTIAMQIAFGILELEILLEGP